MGASVSKQEQVQRNVSNLVSEVLSKSSASTDASTHISANVIQNLKVVQGPSSTLVCLGGIEMGNRINISMQQSVSVINTVSSSMEQELSQKVTAMMHQMLDSEVNRGGGGRASIPLLGSVGGIGFSSNTQSMKTDIENNIKTSVSQAIESFIRIRNEMKTKAEQNNNIELEGKMISFGKCKFDNEFVGRLVANTIAKNIVDGMLKNAVTASLVSSHSSEEKVDEVNATTAAKRYLPLLMLVAGVVLLIFLFKKRKTEEAG